QRRSRGRVLFIHNLWLCAFRVAGTLAWTQRRPYSETSECRHLSIRFESKRRAGAKLWANSSRETGCLFVIQRGVTPGRSGPRQTCSQKFSARSAKLFTVGCGESWRRLSSPPMNNFGPTIRVATQELPWGGWSKPRSILKELNQSHTYRSSNVYFI